MRLLLSVSCCVFFGAALIDAQQPAAPAAATLAGPVSGGKGQAFGALTAQDLATSQFTEAEYFVSGTSQAYDKAGPLNLDGKWTVSRSKRAEYAVRVLVRKPRDAGRFNGVLIVEWLNVTSMQEGAADFMQMKEEIERSGYAWVGIGAQASGVNAPRYGLKAWDAERYASLVHPGDAFSYDIFTQATRALLKPGQVDPLAGLKVQHVIATGRSQSAFRLVTYLNAFHHANRVFNGFLIHSRGANAAGLSAEQLNRDADPIPAGARIRDDAGVPVLDLQAEGDMVTLRAHTTRQPDNPHYRRWEIAGAAHAESPQWVPGITPVPDMAPGLRCASPINTAPHHAVVKGALQALTQWVRDGVAPRSSAPIELGDPAAPDPIVRDALGMARGGIRLPQVEAPTARIDGLRNDVPAGAPGGQNFCFLFGRTEPFDAATLAKLYPTHDAFERRFNAAVDEMVRLGYWLKPEADLARAAAAAAPVGK